MKKLFVLFLTITSLLVISACGSKNSDSRITTTLPGGTTTTDITTTTEGDQFEVAPGVVTVNNLYGDKTIEQWENEYSGIIDVDQDGNGVPDWQETPITLNWAFSKGDLGSEDSNNLLWRLIQKFTEIYPNITVKRDQRFLTTSDKEDLNLYVASSQDGTMPDVFYAPLVAEVYDQDLTLDLTPYLRTDVEAAYISQSIMDFNTSFDKKEVVTVAYRTVAKKMPTINVGLLNELNIPVPSYDWTYDDYETLRSEVGALTDAGQCIYPGIFNFSEIGPRYFDGIPGGWKGYNTETQQWNLTNSTKFGKWLENESEESIEGWHFYDLIDAEQTAVCGNFGSPYADGFQAIDSAVPFWRLTTKLINNYMIDRGLDIDIYPMPQAPDGGDTVMYGYADTMALSYQLADEPVKAQAAFELVRFLSYSVQGMENRYSFLYDDIDTYGETVDDWVAAGNNVNDFPLRHPSIDIVAYIEGFPATSNPAVLELYPLIKGFPEDSYYSIYNFDVFKTDEMLRQLSNIVLFPRNLPAFNDAQSKLSTWDIRDQIRDEGYYYEDVAGQWDDLMNDYLDSYLQNYSKFNN